MGEELLHIVRIDVPCPSCKQKDSQTVSEMIANDQATCGFCRESIDVSSQEWRALIEEMADSLRQIDFTIRP